jgi:asparagine synthase (glutamine-hydrolysing)
MRPVPWIHAKLVHRYREALSGYDRRLQFFGHRPSVQENIDSLDGLRRQLSSDELVASPPYEKRFPFLDRSFAEFMFAVPREQIVRPGQRRSLMRRALVGRVPAEVLDRRRKAYATRGAMMKVLADWSDLEPTCGHMISGELDLINARAFVEAMNKARNGEEVAIAAMVRTLCLEIWLRNLQHFGILSGS